MRKMQSANDAVESESQSLKAHSYRNIPGGERYSAAEDCKRIIEMKGGEGVKYEGKYRRGKITEASTRGTFI